VDAAIPALERAIRILEVIEASPDGVSAPQLAKLGIPRTSLYRILGVLTHSGLLAERLGNASAYLLGPSIRRMASRMSASDDLVAKSELVMKRLADETGETVKVVVRDGLETVAVAVCQPSEDSRVAARVGARLPLHVGAGQRLLLSRAPAEVVEAVFSEPLNRRGLETIVDSEVLRRDLAQLRKRNWALGRNEGVAGVGSIGALIHEPGLAPRAALVLLYILRGRGNSDVLKMRDEVVKAARQIGLPPARETPI
jgi:DNA-binding IclR family transcriptional regulator